MTDAGGRCISDFQYAWEMKGVLLIAPLDDDISKSTAAERRLLDFSGRIFQGSVFISGIYFALIGAKKICMVQTNDIFQRKRDLLARFESHDLRYLLSVDRRWFEELGQPKRNLHQSKSTFRSMTQPQFHSTSSENFSQNYNIQGKFT